LEHAGWHVATVRLIGTNGGAAPTFVLQKQAKEVRVTFQSVPRPFLRQSRYKQILDNYDIDGSARRPDIMLTAPGPTKALHLFVEAKLTDDRGYIVESIYKMLGYLADFDDSLKDSPNPRGVLVVWGGVPKVAADKDNPMLILSAEAVREGMLVSSIEALAAAASE